MELKINKADAISSLVPSASFRWNEETGDISQWSDPNGGSIPSDTEIASEITKLQTEYDAKKYYRNRESEYPSQQEQLDMQYWDSVNGTTTWKDHIAAVKAKYPKPS